MKKIHTIIKRRFRLGTHLNHFNFFHRVKRKNRAKTFKTKIAARLWASLHNLKSEQYYLKNVKHNKRFQIVMYDGKDKNSMGKKNNT